MAGLFCQERVPDPSRHVAGQDEVIFGDDRVLATLLATQHGYTPTCGYLRRGDADIQPHMRRIVTAWMLEVCEEMRCEDQAFPLAVNYLDRVLDGCALPRCQLQALAAVCLLLATKVRQSGALSLRQLVQLTDHSTTEKQLRDLELSVLRRLDWDLHAVTGFDLVEQVLVRLPLRHSVRLIRRHAHTFVAVCATDGESARWTAALVAGACVVAAVAGMRLQGEAQCAGRVAACLQLKPDRLQSAVARLERLVQAESGGFRADGLQYRATAAPAGKDSLGTDQQPHQPDTPTDVQHVCF